MTCPWLPLCMIYCSALRIWSQIYVTCRSCWFPDLVTLYFSAGAGFLGPEGCLHTYEMDTEHFANSNLNVVVAKLVFSVYGVRQNFYDVSVYRYRIIDDRIFYCLLTSMAAVHAENVRASFLSVGDLNGYHQEWLCSTITTRHGVAAFDFATVSGCDELVVGPTHARIGTLDLLISDVLDLLRVAVVAPIGNTDHSCLSAAISMAQAVPDLCVSKEVFLKHQVNWNIVREALQDLPGITFSMMTILLRF